MCGYSKLTIIPSAFGLLLISVIWSMHILNHKTELGHSIQHHVNVQAHQEQTRHVDKSSLGISGIANRSDDQIQQSTDTTTGDSGIAAEARRRLELGHSIQHHANVHALQKQTYHDRNSLGISGIANRSDDQPSTDTAAGDSIIAAEARRHSDNSSCDLRFSEKKLPIVALASPPGAGNTWVRHLLQQATGIYTGSVYRDGRIFQKGYLGEYEDPYSGKCIVTKIHDGTDQANEEFSSAIFLTRNVLDCCISEINRHKSKDHTGVAQTNALTSRSLLKQARRMHNVATFWLTRFNHPLLIVQYEYLVNDTKGAVTRMLDFLNVSVKDRRMQCLANDLEGTFHRQSHGNIQKRAIDNVTMDFMNNEMRYISDLLKTRNSRQRIDISIQSN